MYLVFSTSLNPESRSRILAELAQRELRQLELEVDSELIDLAAIGPLPACNGFDCYNDPLVGPLAEKISNAEGVLIATPVYNYSVSSSCKNLVELTGQAWNDKVVGLMCASGGQGSYMAPMSLMNSLMLDFRCLCLPKFVYAAENCFANGQIQDEQVIERVKMLSRDLVRISSALRT